MGYPDRAGKTALARAVLFNPTRCARPLIAILDRIEQARRMGWLCDRVVEAGHTAIADFISPTPETRAAFGPAPVKTVPPVQSAAAPSPVPMRQQSHDLSAHIETRTGLFITGAQLWKRLRSPAAAPAAGRRRHWP